jgi:hypothetical protein
MTGIQTIAADPFAHVTKAVTWIVGAGVWRTSVQISLPQGVKIIGVLSPQSIASGSVIQASNSFPLDSPIFRNNCGRVAEGVVLESLVIDGNGRSDGIMFNDIRSSQITDVLVENVRRANDYGLKMVALSGADSTNANHVYSFTTLSCWGGIYVSGFSNRAPVFDVYFYALRIGSTQYGVYIDNVKGVSSAQRLHFFAGVIDTNSLTAIGIFDGGMYDSFYGWAFENSPPGGMNASTGLMAAGGTGIYLEMLPTSGWSTGTNVSVIATLHNGGDFVSGRTAQWNFKKVADPPPGAAEGSSVSVWGSSVDGNLRFRSGTGSAYELWPVAKGRVSTSASTIGSAAFGVAFTSTPICVVTPTESPGSAVYWVSATNLVVTVNLSIAATLTFNYTCSGDPN